jgi:hypothetical protein
MQPDTIDTTTWRDALTATLNESLELMAFCCAMPAGPDAPCPEDAMLLAMCFSGPFSGRVEIVVGRPFGRHLAASMLALGIDDPQIGARGDDCLRELLNVVVGALMPRIAGDPNDVFDLTLPLNCEFASEAWRSFANSSESVILDADGFTIAARVMPV